MSTKKKPISTVHINEIVEKDSVNIRDIEGFCKNPIDLREESFIEQYNSCDLCGTPLEFAHVTHFIDNIVVEERGCPNCMIRATKKEHVLQ